MNFLSTTFKYFNLLGGFATIGALLAMAFLLLDDEGKVSTSAEKLRNFLKVSAATWFIGVIGSIVFTLAQILDSSLAVALDPTVVRSFVTQITLGQYLAFEALIAFLVFVYSFQARKILSLIFLLGLSVVGIIAPVFQSHAASSGSHSLIIGSLVIHVIGLSLWVGGILAIAMLSASDRAIAVPRFSQLALWAAIAVVISGTVNAWTRLNFTSAWDSTYAYIVIAKLLQPLHW
jgi:putative copper resistance protein D